MSNDWVERIRSGDDSATEHTRNRSITAQRAAIKAALKEGHDEIACELIERSYVRDRYDELALQNGCFKAARTFGLDEYEPLDYASLIEHWYDQETLDYLTFFDDYDEPRSTLRRKLIDELIANEGIKRQTGDSTVAFMDETVTRTLGRLLFNANELDDRIDDYEQLQAFIDGLLQDGKCTARTVEGRYRQVGADHQVYELLYEGAPGQDIERIKTIAGCDDVSVQANTILYAAKNRPACLRVLFEQRDEEIDVNDLLVELAENAASAIEEIAEKIPIDELRFAPLNRLFKHTQDKPGAFQDLLKQIDDPTTYRTVLHDVGRLSMQDNPNATVSTIRPDTHGALFEYGADRGWFDERTQQCALAGLCAGQKHTLGDERMMQYFYDAGGQLRSFDEYERPGPITFDPPDEDPIEVLAVTNESDADGRGWVDVMLAEQSLGDERRRLLFETLTSRADNRTFMWAVEKRGIEPDDEHIEALLQNVAAFTYVEDVTDYLLQRYPDGPTELFVDAVEAGTGGDARSVSHKVDELITSMLEKGLRPAGRRDRLFTILNEIYDINRATDEAVETSVKALGKHRIRPPANWTGERINDLVEDTIGRRQQNVRNVSE